MKLTVRDIAFLFSGFIIGMLFLLGSLWFYEDQASEYNMKVLDASFNLATSLACFDACKEVNCSFCSDWWDNKIVKDGDT